MISMDSIKKPGRCQFPTFRGAQRDLLHVKAVAEKQGVSYAAMMNVILASGIAAMEGTETFKLSDEKLEAIHQDSLV